MYLLLALFGLIGFALLVRVRRRGFIIGLLLIGFLFSSTEAFYRLLFVGSNAAESIKKPGCAVAVTDGKDIAEAAVLVSSIRRLGTDNLYILSTKSDATLPAQLNQFFMKEQNLKFLTESGLNDEKFRGCVYAYSPHLYCSVTVVNTKYTLLPKDMFHYIPTATFMTINSETIGHCLAVVFK